MAVAVKLSLVYEKKNQLIIDNVLPGKWSGQAEYN